MEEKDIQEQLKSLENEAKSLNATLESLKTEKVEDQDGLDDKFKEITDKLEANQKSLEGLLKEKAHQENMKRIELLEKQAQEFSKKVQDGIVVPDGKITIPATGESLGNLTVEQKGWEAILRERVTLKDGEVKLTEKALDTSTSTQGTEWVTTGVVPGLVEMVRQHANLAGALKQVILSNKSDDVLVQTGDATVYVQTEATSDNASALTGSQLATNKKNMASKRIGAVTWISDQFEDDSLIDIIGAVRTAFGQSFGLEADSMIINGDTSVTHQDSDTTNAADVRKAFSALRYLGLNTTGLNSNVNDTTPSLDAFITVLNLLGKYGASNVVFACGPKGRNDILASTWSTTNSNSANHVQVIDGKLELFGFPVLVSEKCREDLNASGVYDGTTTTKRTILAIRADRHLFGIRKNISIELDRRPIQAQTAVVGSMRVAYAPAVTPHATTEPSVAIGYNI